MRNYKEADKARLIENGKASLPASQKEMDYIKASCMDEPYALALEIYQNVALKGTLHNTPLQ